MNKYYYSSERIAIVAMSCLMPDAADTNILWKNILDKKISIKELPEYIFDKSVFYQSDVLGKIYKNDKSYSKIGAIVDEIDFLNLGKKYRIPPAISTYFDNNQKAAIYCMDQAMEQIKSSLPKERTAVIMSSGAPGIKFENVVRRAFYANVEDKIRNHQMVKNGGLAGLDQVLSDVSSEVLKYTQPVTEDTPTGYLQNITSGRIANIFDFWGPSYTVDSACASSLTAISISVAGLLNHEYDAVISGGVEVSLSEASMIAFSGINALSPDGSFPFDTKANGFVMGLGGGLVVLKRLSDALRDGDHIYSVISGYGMGSDGKGKYIAAPSEEGQIRIIQSACKMAGYSVDTVEMLEAHGTGTTVGDVVEIAALKKAFAGLGMNKENSCGLGSIKSNIGHLRNAAGVAGLIKATLALYNKTLPASANVDNVNPKLDLNGSPFYVITDNKEWKENPLHPRRANVSSYGFGGQNCHVCLEEFRPEFLPKVFSISDTDKPKSAENNSCERVEKEEVVFFSAESGEANAAIQKLEDEYQAFIEDTRKNSFEEAVYQNNITASFGSGWRIAICADSVEQLNKKWNTALEYIKGDRQKEAESLTLKGIHIGKGKKIESSEIAIMFPGQGSQYPNMLKKLYNTYPVVKAFYMKADALWKEKYNTSVLSIIFNDGEGQEEVLKNTKNTHPAMFFSNMGAFKLLCEAGIKADYMIGHSLGEVTSLYAGGMLDLKSAVKIIGERGLSFDSIDEKQRGSMVSIKENAYEISNIIKANGFKLGIANINSSEQTVVGGDTREIARFMEFLKDKGYKHTLLNVSHAFHTEIVSKAAETFYDNIKDIKFKKPECKVMACHLSEFYSEAVGASKNLADILKDQILLPINFKESVYKLYNNGVRVFIEAGPSDILTNLAKNILSDKDVKIVSINKKGKSSMEGFNKALAALFAYGVDVSPIPTNNLLGIQKEVECTPITEKASTEVKVNNSVKESLVYSGVSFGLPGSFKKAFSDENFDYLIDGKNLIEMLTDEEAQSILDLNISRLIKTEKAAVFKKISSLNEVIHFVGKFGKMDMINDYLIDEKLLNQMTQTVCAGVAAGYEALKDAGIPLVREYVKTSSGALLPKRLTLPKEMQDDTGIIFANGLYPVESIISEVSKFTAAKFGSYTRRDMINFFEAVISKVSDYESKKLLSDWFTLHYSRLVGNPSETDLYEFNHNFLLLLCSQANNRLAQLIGATGPNMFISAACSSTTSAVTVAEGLIKAGHAHRMIVVGSDITSGKNLLQWFGAAFSSIGSLTDSDNLFEAAVPFDNRRKGMILGSGAVGLIIEKEADVEKRGMKGICRILGTHMFNSAGHQARVDEEKHCIELDRFISKMEAEHALDRKTITSKLVYCSHETYSNKQGGCSSMEKAALEHTFGEKFREVKVINTKGMTGHTLGASIEEAVSAKALQYQKIPPIVNYKEADPKLDGLNLSRGGEYEFEYVLRTVSAFGGQGNYHLLQRLAKGDERVFNDKVYREWIDSIASKDAKLINCGRLLVAEADHVNEPIVNETVPEIIEKKLETKEIEVSCTADTFRAVDINKSHATKVSTCVAGDNQKVKDADLITEEVIAIFSDITKYPKEMLDLSMEVEADLGIDTVKQATIFSILADKYNFDLLSGEALSNYPTIGHMVQVIINEVKSQSNAETTNAEAESQTNIKTQKEAESKSEEMQTASVNIKNISREILELISTITKYPLEMLEDDMELEADLGIDTIKQATIFSELSEKFKLNISLNQSDFKTIKSIIQFVKNNVLKDNNSEETDKTNRGEKTSKIIVQDIRENNARADGDGIENEAHMANTEDFELDLCVQSPVIIEEEIGSKDYDLKGKKLIIIGDSSENVQKIAEYFKKISNVSEFVFENSRNTEELKANIAGLKDKIESADVIFDCSHIGKAYNFSKLKYQEESEILRTNSLFRFVFYKELVRIKPKPELRILCAVLLEGCFGFTEQGSSTIDPYYGALCGFYKGLRKEFDKSKVKIVDLGISEAFTWNDMVFNKIVAELEEKTQSCEIGYWQQKRVTLSLDNVDRKELLPKESFDSSHFVITGGGNGITTEIVREISRKFKAKFSIVGRTKLPFNVDELSTLSEASLEQKKLEIYDRYKHEGKKAAPAEVEKEFNSIKKAISVYKLLKEINNSGSDAQYFSCDVAIYSDLKAVVQKATAAFGPANVIIHGAGVEKSKLIEQKTEEEYQEVFDAKTKGLCNLYRLTKNKDLRVLIGFSSISGRFGNGAQLDYCAANNFISSFMSAIKSANRSIRTVSISWSGWKDVGMAWRNEFVKENSEEMGLNLIEPDRATNEFLNILTSPINKAELVVSKGLSYFTGDKKWYDIKNSVTLIDWICKKDGEIQRIHKILSVKKDPIINHHRLGKTPLMPAVGFMEIGAQAHSLIYGKSEQYRFNDIKLLNPLKLFNEKPQELIMLPKKISGSDAISAVFYNSFKPKIGKSKLTLLNSMNISGSIGEYDYLKDLRSIESNGMIEMSLQDSLDETARRLSNAIRLGPLFMDEKASKINKFKYNEQGVIFTIALSEEQLTNKKYNLPNLLINPAFADSLMQACGIHSSIETEVVYLPWGIGEFGIVKVPRETGLFKAFAKMIKEEGDEKTYDVILYGKNDEIHYYAKNVIVKRIAK